MYLQCQRNVAPKHLLHPLRYKKIILKIIPKLLANIYNNFEWIYIIVYIVVARTNYRIGPIAEKAE